MNRQRFDHLTRALTSQPSRRHLVGGLVGVCAWSVARLPHLASAKKRKRKRKKKLKVRFNEFGCVNVGGFCQTSDQCCSGICEGNKRKNLQRCQAHDAGGCQLANDTCLHEEDVLCPDDGGVVTMAVRPFCFQTTGKAGFCGFRVGEQCVACSKDADCVADFGAGAACVVCPRFCADAGHTTCIPAEI